MSWKRDAAASASCGLSFEDELADETAEAAGRRDEPLVMALEQLPVGAGLVVVAVDVRGAAHLDEVVVADVRFREQREVVDLVLGALRTVEARPVGEVRLHAEHGRDARVASGAVQLEDPVHVAVVGDADRGLPVGDDRPDDVAHP